jgi:alkylation response protein AidB-like acyl-CoA dehydrogenase
MSPALGVPDELRAWLEGAWEPEAGLARWRARLADAGWGCPTWPTEWGGRGLSAAEGEEVARTLAEWGVPGPASTVGLSLVAPTLLAHGSVELKTRLLGPIATGDARWCQLFSEPGAGSDLASLATRAELDGGEWVVSGQKVWSTGAAQAQYGLLLARTDRDAPRHLGITCLVLPMRQAGVEVRALRQMNDHASFNEVFLDGARVPAADVIGEPGGGWVVARTTLAHERRLGLARLGGPHRDPHSRTWREALAEQRELGAVHSWYPQRAGRVDRLVEHAHASGRGADALVRQNVTLAWSLATTARLSARRAAAARADGRAPGAEGSLAKLAASSISRAGARAHGSIAGAAGLVTGPGGALGGVVAEILLSAPAQSIAGGTDEIQRNIVAERILQMPKEPSTEPSRSSREVPRSVG